jgi:all-trans-retinol 13,14-reductase
LTTTRADAVVIGSGISGLTVAALLAKSGHQVIILEKNRKAGGAMRRFSRGGIPFDIGFHYTGGLGKNQILRVLWEHLGIWPKIEAVPLHPNGYDLFCFNNSATKVRAFYNYDLLLEELLHTFPTESDGIKKYLSTVKDICEKVPFYNLNLELEPFLRDFSTSKTRRLAETIASLTGNKELQTVMAGPAFLYGVPPDKTDVAMHATVAHAYYSGAYGIKGGGQSVVDAFLQRLASQGVEIITSSKVNKINISGDQVTGVTVNGKEINTKHVVYTGHPNHLPEMVPEGSFRPAYRNRLKDLKDTPSSFIVFGKISNPESLSRLEKSNLYYSPAGLDLFGQTSNTLMVTAPGRRDGGNGKASQGVILMRPASWEETTRFTGINGARGTGYEEWKSSSTKQMISRAAQAFGESFLDIEPLTAGSPLTFKDELGSPSGGIYGVQHSIDQYVARARTKIRGLLLSGQGTLMTGVMGASLAGVVTVGEIIGIEKIWGKIKTCR